MAGSACFRFARGLAIMIRPDYDWPTCADLRSPLNRSLYERAQETRFPLARRRNISFWGLLLALFACLFCVGILSACGGGSGGASSSSGVSGDETSGNPFTLPSSVELSIFDPEAATGQNNAQIDVSSASLGYVGASGVSGTRLKLRITKGEQAMNYDMHTDGTPVIAPLNMGSGNYTVAVMQDTTGSRYVELYSVNVNANIQTEQSPYLVPNVFCDYDENSAVVAKARELVRDASNEGDALRIIYEWIKDNVRYDKAKAADLSGKQGYVPNPDETLQSQTGICLDYAALAGAMLRSIGIPCKVVTGYVSPDGVYHAWNMVWIDGTWKNVNFTVNPKDWTRIDLTRAANGSSPTVGDGKSYTDRYVY